MVFGQVPITLSGKVISEEGVIPNAYLTIGAQGTLTNDSGLFQFQCLDESNTGIIRIQVSTLGYRTQEFEYPVKEVNLKDLTIILSLFPDITAETALADINNGELRFLLSGGIAPVIYASDKKFTRKYGVSFYEFGCEAVAAEALKSYNEKVAEYLDHRYGIKWRQKIRPDIMGINQF